MGKLVYGNFGAELSIEDRSLNHLKVVILAKLRRGENFSLTWENDQGHYVIWLHPSIPVFFKFNGKREPTINRAWVDAMMLTANSNTGLTLVPEPGPVTNRPIR